jgi:hypothetical protein
MSIEETIQFLTDSAAEQEAKLAKLERNSALLEKALRRLSERQKLLELWAAHLQAVLDDLEQRPFRRRRKARSVGHSIDGCRENHRLPYRDCRPARRPAH